MLILNITVAIDSFKGSLNTFQGGNAVKNGIRKVYPDADIYGCDVNFDVTINGKRNTYNRLINVFRDYR